MAAPAIGVRPRWVPGPGASIDWSHPLAGRLAGAQIGSRALGGFTVASTAAPVTSSPWGRSVDCSGSAMQIGFPPVPMADGITLAAVGVWVSGFVFFLSSDNLSGLVGGGSATRNWQFLVNTGGSVEAVVFNAAQSAPATNFVTSGVVTSGVPFAVLMTIAANRTTTVYVRSQTGASAINSTSASSAGDWTTAVTRADIGRVNPTVGSVAATFMWHRALTAEQARAWLADPLSVLRS